jgi:hypothetical protein
MDLQEAIRRNGLEVIGRYYSTYRGIVISRELEGEEYTGRLYVHCPGISSGVTVWAVPKYQYGTLGCGFKFIDPLAGSIVWVEFRMGIIGNAMWIPHGWTEGTPPEELNGPNKTGFVTPLGNSDALDDNKGERIIKFNKTFKEAKLEIKGGPAEGNIEPALKGNELTTILQDLITAIKQITVPTPNGTSGQPLNIASFAKIENILSSKKPHLSKLIFLQ